MNLDKEIKIPKKYRKKARNWILAFTQTYECSETDMVLVFLIADAIQLADDAQKVLDVTGMTYQDRYFQPKKRPEVDILNQNRVAIAKLLRELGMSDDETAEMTRPPQLRTISRSM